MHNPLTSDIQSETNPSLPALNWVGMSQIESSMLVDDLMIPCQLDIGVNLRPGFRGIHMSRLYQLHLEYFLRKNLDEKQVELFLSESLKSQEQTSSEVSVKIEFQLPTKTVSLKSELAGYRNYPVQIIFERTPQMNRWISFEILYSSTCPQSAGLSVEALRDVGLTVDRLPATPHAQRSRARIKLQLKEFSIGLIRQLIAGVENQLGTPVQTSVKRADEMEFARLNAQNLMFCEDAVRSISDFLQKNSGVLGFSVFCEHFESLHSHNASCLKKHHWTGPEFLHFS
ncbi:MAG: hypothetical protein A2622_00895 [Bdellovibrionales bacterium RIFCSPHIGHO2_01_FULL_40_29]|nr:MAG: hypothetical protein A2622_00895 [Bdellovibrionales bacterium RIFCSPHIGHO2_01_FULL_40_29]OFZ32786.1 MAG: hypothetical protein A3D17_05495 [Bdellovibrionales bacterium RIFCSPHIGHO2_02_FULL_40_15]